MVTGARIAPATIAACIAAQLLPSAGFFAGGAMVAKAPMAAFLARGNYDRRARVHGGAIPGARGGQGLGDAGPS